MNPTDPRPLVIDPERDGYCHSAPAKRTKCACGRTCNLVSVTTRCDCGRVHIRQPGASAFDQSGANNNPVRPGGNAGCPGCYLEPEERPSLHSPEEKACSACGEVKPLSAFRVDGRIKPTGRATMCKDCGNARSRAKAADRHLKGWDERLERERQRYVKYRDRRRKQRSQHRRDYPEMVSVQDPVKEAARRAVRAAVKAGRLIKPDRCEGCGDQLPKRALHGHHEVYARPLDVDWLCTWCHGKRHRKEPANAA